MKIFTKEHKKKLSIARQGKKPALGIKHSEETRKLISDKSKARWNDPEYKAHMSIKRKEMHRQNPNRMKEIAKLVPKGSESSQWRGDKIKYFGIHQWLQKYYGKAYICQNLTCELKELNLVCEWAKLKHVDYERKRENFVMLCRSCHRKYDKKNGEQSINLKLS